VFNQLPSSPRSTLPVRGAQEGASRLSARDRRHAHGRHAD
jgi:hypothetical protein